MDVKFELSPGSPESVYRNEVKCSAFDMENDFSFHANKLTPPFYKKGCALSLILKVRVFGACERNCQEIQSRKIKKNLAILELIDELELLTSIIKAK